ncbi:MAG TPA: TatD family hydrolase [Acidimicrobiia bacterium]
MGWVDSHCHLQSVSGDTDAVLGRAREAGVEWLVCVGTDLETSHQAVELAAGRPGLVRATVGLHPHEASRLDAEWNGLVELVGSTAVVAVGECGFDLYYEHSPRDAQEAAFRAQIRLAHERDLALVIHSRDAWDDTFRVLGDEGVPARTVFHCFTGGEAEARRVLDLGAALSFSGIVSFPNAGDVRAAAGLAPADRLLVETDAPYLAPVPHRGRENEPAFVGAVGAAVAAARSEPAERVAATSAAAAARLLGGGP